MVILEPHAMPETQKPPSPHSRLQTHPSPQPSVPESQDALQYASLFLDKKRSSSETGTYALTISHWLSYNCLDTLREQNAGLVPVTEGLYCRKWGKRGVRRNEYLPSYGDNTLLYL